MAADSVHACPNALKVKTAQLLLTFRVVPMTAMTTQ